MGIEFDLISDSTREGYELGKGPWYADKFEKALRSVNPVEEVTAFLIAASGAMGYGEYTLDYAKEIAEQVAAFIAAHPDWRIINDHSCDIVVMTAEDEAEDREEAVRLGLGADDPDLPIYRKIGSRYR